MVFKIEDLEMVTNRIFLKVEPPPISECQLSRFESYFGTKIFIWLVEHHIIEHWTVSNIIFFNIERTHPCSSFERQTWYGHQTNIEKSPKWHAKVNKNLRIFSLGLDFGAKQSSAVEEFFALWLIVQFHVYRTCFWSIFAHKKLLHNF